MTFVYLLHLALSGVIVILLIAVWLTLRRQSGADPAATMGPLLQQSGERLERLERALRDELGRVNTGLREEVGRGNAGLRQETLTTLTQFQQALLTQGGDTARSQNEQIDAFRVQLAQLQQSLAQQAATAREAQDAAAARTTTVLTEQLQALAQRNEAGLAETGRTDGAAQRIWLPIDAKCPREDYERLLEAQERADAPAAELAGRAIETRLRLE